MTGEAEPSEEITVNEMRVRVSGGPRRYVAAIIKQGSEYWGVDHHVIEMNDGDVVGFLNNADADHFITQGRALDLGRWNNMSELQTAYAEQMATQAVEKRTPRRHKRDAT